MSILVRLLVGLCVGVAGALGPLYLYGRATAKNAELQAQIANQQRDMAAMRKALNEQNAAIQDWIKTAETESERSRKVEAQAIRSMAEAEKQAGQIMEVKVLDGDCLSSIQWASNASRELARVWK